MAYNPSIYLPTWQQPQQQPVNGVVYVTVEEAKNYSLPPNSVSPPLMLKTDNVFFIKVTDASGGGTLNAYRFEEIPISSVAGSDTNYVTKQDFAAFETKVMEALNGKHFAKPQETPAE